LAYQAKSSKNDAVVERAQKQIPSHLKSEIRKMYPIQEVKEAIRDYTNQMTGGKILLRMS